MLRKCFKTYTPLTEQTNSSTLPPSDKSNTEGRVFHFPEEEISWIKSPSSSVSISCDLHTLESLTFEEEDISPKKGDESCNWSQVSGAREWSSAKGSRFRANRGGEAGVSRRFPTGLVETTSPQKSPKREKSPEKNRATEVERLIKQQKAMDEAAHQTVSTRNFLYLSYQKWL